MADTDKFCVCFTPEPVSIHYHPEGWQIQRIIKIINFTVCFNPLPSRRMADTLTGGCGRTQTRVSIHYHPEGWQILGGVVGGQARAFVSIHYHPEGWQIRECLKIQLSCAKVSIHYHPEGWQILQIQESPPAQSVFQSTTIPKDGRYHSYHECP